MAKNYSSTKGSFIQSKMNSGSTNREARKEWNEKHDLNYLAGKFKDSDITGVNVDRSFESPTQDWAEDSDDI